MMETFSFRVAEGEVNKPGVMGTLPLSGMFYLPLVPPGKCCGQPSNASCLPIGSIRQGLDVSSLSGPGLVQASLPLPLNYVRKQQEVTI